MTCERLLDGSGRAIGHMCTRGRKRRARCVVCKDGIATHLCDGELAADDVKFARQTTCDAPLCSECLSPRGEHDFCPQHDQGAGPAQTSLFG